MYAMVTGAAGFIGCHLVYELLNQGHSVVGIDSMTDYYDFDLKRKNLEWNVLHPRFEFLECDVRSLKFQEAIFGADVVFHLAGQPGVRGSWSDGFATYSQLNIEATQSVLECAKQAGIRRMVYASSSSIYGDAIRFPVEETDLPRPRSPYGVTKLAAEHLCSLYAENFGLSTVSLRYFTVYGPRQRPDMAMARIINAALQRTPFRVFGAGDQLREFTYVSDVVRANLMAAAADLSPGTVLNISGGSTTTLLSVIGMIGEILGTEVVLDFASIQNGDVKQTNGSIARARELLGWTPEVDIRRGLELQIDHQASHFSQGNPGT
jgi:nucleoside-diphosphate-sugar epimerase